MRHEYNNTSDADGKDVRLGGGVATIRQYLREKLIDDMHLAISPMLLGSGENLFAGIDMSKLGYRCSEQVATPNATHVIIKRDWEVAWAFCLRFWRSPRWRPLSPRQYTGRNAWEGNEGRRKRSKIMPPDNTTEDNMTSE